MNKRLLTLDDLYAHYSSSNRSAHFSSKDENKNIVVQIPGTVKFEEYDAKQGLLPVKLQACHTLENANKSYISEESMNEALASFANRPILGYIYYNESTMQHEFYTHNMHEEDGEIVYDEWPVGVIPESCDAHLEYDEEKGHNYVVTNGIIYEEYSKAAEILQREQECFVSAELSINELSYNGKDKVLSIDSFFFSGVTILGRKPDGSKVQPGMDGSNIKLSDFKADKNSVFAQKDIIARLEELENKVSELSINNNSGKEEDGTMTKFEELLEKYSKTAEEIEFDYEGLSDDELEQAFAAAFNDAEPEGEPEGEPVAEPEGEPEGDPEVEEKFSKTFELSHDDIRYALYGLLGQYEEADGDYYDICTVFDDRFVYVGWMSGKYYGQGYDKADDNVALVGERYQLFPEFLTESERVELEAKRKRCCELEECAIKLAKYEAEPEKMAILESPDYGYVSEAEEFIALKEQDAHFDLTVEEVRAKADEILMKYAKAGNFAKTEENTMARSFALPVNNKKTSRYGDLFKRD